MLEELRKYPLDPCPRCAVPEGSQPQTDIRAVVSPREDPPVSGEGSPRSRLPEDDGRTFDFVAQ